MGPPNANGSHARRWGHDSKEKAPSRWRLRPASRLTAAEAATTRRAINLGRSVLGASRTLGGSLGARQDVREANFSQIAIFSFHNSRTAHGSVCSGRSREEKGPGTKARPQEFAEPGTLSSTFPTNLPLPRSAPRGASSYRRPVLGAGRNLGEETCPCKRGWRRNFAQIAATLARRTSLLPARGAVYGHAHA